MKKIASVVVSLALLTQAPAQLFSPESLHGALWGSFIGGMVDSDYCHGFSGEGAAIGAGIGLIAGALVGESRRHNDYYETPAPAYAAYPSVSFGYGYGSGGSSAYVNYAPNNYCAPGYYYRPTRPNYAVSGTVLGAASGALIGSANCNAGEGAAIGAAAGLVVGGVAELVAHREEKRVVAAQNTAQPAAVTATATQDAGTQTTEVSAAHSEITSKPGPTSTYYWTARPQIADAPRVPDAPTF